MELGRANAGASKAAKLRLKARSRTASGAVHEGFYDFAAAVVRPQPTARRHAALLQECLDAQLSRLREGRVAGTASEPLAAAAGDADCGTQPPVLSLCDGQPSPRAGGTFLTADADEQREAPEPEEPAALALPSEDPQAEHQASLAAVDRARSLQRARDEERAKDAESAQREVELCLETLQQYASDVSTDSRERGLLFQSALGASGSALSRLCALVRRTGEEARSAEDALHQAEEEKASLLQENRNLRKMMSQAMSEESRLQAEGRSASGQLATMQQVLEEAHRRMSQLSSQLDDTSQELGRLRAEAARKRDSMRDASCDPMLSFAVFPTEADEAPPPAKIQLPSAQQLRQQLQRPPPGSASPCPSARQQESRAPSESPKLSDAAAWRSEQDAASRDGSPQHQQAPDEEEYPEGAEDSSEHWKAQAEAAAEARDRLAEEADQLRERCERESAKAEAVQKSLDESLGHVSTWVQEVHDSLKDMSSSTVSRDMLALSVVRDAVDWLRDHLAEEWSEADESLCARGEEVHAALAADRPIDAQVAELRARLAEEKQKAENIAFELAEARKPPSRQATPRVKVTRSGLPNNLRHAGTQTRALAPDASGQGFYTLSSQNWLQDAPSRPVTRSSKGDMPDFPKSDGDGPPPTPPAAASATTERSAKEMRMLRSRFVEDIDLSVVPETMRVLLRPPPTENNLDARGETNSGSDEPGLTAKQLRSVLADVLATKRSDDAHRDRVQKPRRTLCEVLQETLRRQHGIKRVVHQKSWQLAQSLLNHSAGDRAADLFVDFLDSSRDNDELSFYLYCSCVIVSSSEESRATAPPSQAAPPQLSWERALRVATQLFGDLPKAMDVARAELEKCVGSQLANSEQDSEIASEAAVVPTVAAEDLLWVLLEAWRVGGLLLDQSVPGFSWRSCLLTFMQADQLKRGWLDPHEVFAAEGRLGLPPASASGLRAPTEHTSLGAYVFRVAHRCGAAPGHSLGAASPGRRGRRAQGSEAALEVSWGAFQSLERALGVYLTWLMHSDELRDIAVYHSVKARLFNFRQSHMRGDNVEGVHHFRSLLLLLLSHQFDVQLQRRQAEPEPLKCELDSLLAILRDSWRRGASEGDGPSLELDAQS